MSNTPGSLSLEQELQIHLFTEQVKEMDELTVKDALKRYYEIMIRREAMYKHFIAHEWGLVPPHEQDDSLNEWG